MESIIDPLSEEKIQAMAHDMRRRLDAADSEETIETPERFCIDSEERANWLLRKLAAIDGERERVKTQAEIRCKELDSHREQLMHRFGAELQAWAKEEAIRRRRQTVTIQQGTLVFRAQGARLVVADHSDALTTARIACPETITTETIERFDKSAFLDYATRHFEATGDLLPGIDRTPAGESFTVRFGGKKGKTETTGDEE